MRTVLPGRRLFRLVAAGGLSGQDRFAAARRRLPARTLPRRPPIVRGNHGNRLDRHRWLYSFYDTTVESGYIIHGYIIQPLISAIFGRNRICT